MTRASTASAGEKRKPGAGVKPIMTSALLLPQICIANPPGACTNCGMHAGCLPAGLNPRELASLDSLITPRYRVRRGDHLFHAGAPFQSLFAIRSGSVKSSILDDEGREQIMNFNLAGELLGMDAIGTGKHICNVIALEDSEACKIPYHELQQLGRDIPALARNLNCMMSQEIARGYGVMLLLGCMNAEERTATFLLSLSHRYVARGYSPSQLVLRMSRNDIGSYLGLKLETISRTFSSFQSKGMIAVHGREIHLLDLEKLKAVMQGTEPQPGRLLPTRDAGVMRNRFPAPPPGHGATTADGRHA